MVGATVQRTENGQTVNISSNYAYNHNGMRVRASSTANGIASNRIFLLDEINHTGYAQILEETNNGSLVKSYTIGDDILSQSSGSGVRHFLYDGHGSTRMLADTSGAITSRYDYDAYGIMVGGNPNLANPAETDMLYSGEQFDIELQQQYLRARLYDQNTGRFPSLDPYAGNNYDPQSLHKYNYCHNDPVNGIDPSGEICIEITVGMAIMISVAAIFSIVSIGLAIKNVINTSIPYSGEFRNKVIIFTGHSKREAGKVTAYSPVGRAIMGTIEIYKARHGTIPYTMNPYNLAFPTGLGVKCCWGVQTAQAIRGELKAQGNNFIKWIDDYGYNGNYLWIYPNIGLESQDPNDPGYKEAPQNYKPMRIVEIDSEIKSAAKLLKADCFKNSAPTPEIIFWDAGKGYIIERENL